MIVVMPNSFEIRRAQVADAPFISKLIHNVAHYFSSGSSGEVAKWFLDSVAPTAIEGYISNTKYNYLVAHSQQVLVGVIAVRDTTHIHHLFVAPEQHRQGVATQLWMRAMTDALNAGNTDGFFVRSSEYAVPVYTRFGFRVAGAKSEKDGVLFVPMRLELAHKRGQSGEIES